MTFSENLKTIRKQKGFTQEELAIRCNVVRQTVSKWEKGLSVPDADLLVKLADVLEVEVVTLLGGDIQKENANEIAQQLARINEQLAIKNRRAKRIWRGVIIALAVLIIVPLTAAFVFGTVRSSKTQKPVGSVDFKVTYQDKEYFYSMSYNENYEVLEGGGDAFISYRVESDGDVNEFYVHLKEYFEERGGKVEIISNQNTGYPLLEA